MAVKHIMSTVALGLSTGLPAPMLTLVKGRQAQSLKSMRLLVRRVVNRLSKSAAPGEGLAVACQMKVNGLAIGEHCSISPRAVITDPAYITMGDNVRLSDCHIFGHDGSINMINRMAGTCFDAVDKVEIGSNVFIGHGAIVLPGTRIGDRVIIGAGAVVKGDIEGGFVYGGNPLRRIRSIERHLDLLDGRDQMLPAEWKQLIQQRGSEFDPALEPDLVKVRIKHLLAA